MVLAKLTVSSLITHHDVINRFLEEYAQKKKTDEPTPDDPHSSEESEDTDVEQLPEEKEETDEQPPNLENEVFFRSHDIYDKHFSG